jgi:protoporphyrin/coproporphyrin ferrochelatase
MVDAGCRKILFFPLYPQYAGATTATANDAFFRALI